MSGNGEKITRHQERAIAALIQQSTLSAAARASGISEATLRRWKKQPAFAKAWTDARRALVADTVSMIQRAGNAALATLLKIMTDEKAASTARTQAARAVLELGLRERPSGVQLKAATTAKDISIALGEVIHALASGELNPEEGQALGVLLETHRKAIETAILERQIEELERGRNQEVSDEYGESEKAA
jgi:hypothetical protein